ncbi:transporter [Povalibacter sp.]|uniref:transporter n=1 Tax=Povalibacter sp. TaxID=1962978 RepID=UPI002F3FFAFF
MRTVLLLVSILINAVTCAQELEPRAYSPNPAGVNFVVAGYGQSTGGVLFDPSLPFSDVEARLSNAALGYGHTFGVFGRGVTALFAVPYVWGDISGNVGEDRRAISRSGLADTRFKLSINLLGGPALPPAEFAARKPDTTLGASLSIIAPTGEYDSSRLINIGSNRWAFKPELGISHPIGRLFLEASAGVWLFTANDEFFDGTRREQDPISALQVHVSYTFRPRLWIAADATYYEGGRTTVSGQRRGDLQANSRVGTTLALPIGQRQSLKFTWSDGASTRVGGDFTNYGIAWQYTWF